MEMCELAEQYGEFKAKCVWTEQQYFCEAPECPYSNRNEKTHICRTQGRKTEKNKKDLEAEVTKTSKQS